MVCYVFNYTVIADLSMAGCFDIVRVDDEHWDFRSLVVATEY